MFSIIVGNVGGAPISIIRQYIEQQTRPHYKVARAKYPSAIIQSCYPERLDEKNSQKTIKSTVEVLLKELLIKLKVQQRKLLFDYPVLPEEPWFITQMRPENIKDKWPAFYCRVAGQHLEFGAVPEHILENIEISLNTQQRKRLFTGMDRPHIVFWPETEHFLLLNDTEVVCLPNEAELHTLVKEVDQTVASGIPTELIASYCKSFPDSSIIQHLSKLNLTSSHNIAAADLKEISYKGRDNQHFYDYLATQGYRLKASLQSKQTGLLSVTSGVLISKVKALYTAGSVGGAQRKQENFNHIYHVETDLEQIPEWFWNSLEVWHVRHKGATVYPYIFKHLNEYIERQSLLALIY